MENTPTVGKCNEMFVMANKILDKLTDGVKKLRESVEGVINFPNKVLSYDLPFCPSGSHR